ncbi:HotDog domain-containing protein [Entophlyctis helioformis]|nr:HotDog domain-containing protein [Entophlyctis helioformis]
MHRGRPLEVVQALLKKLPAGDGFSALTLNKLQVLSATADRVVCEMPVESHHLNLVHGLHGGLTATLVDVGGSLAIAAKTHSTFTGVSTDLSVSYLAGGKLGDNLRVEAECAKAGRTLAFTQVKIFAGDRIIATGSHTKFIANARGAGASE